MPDGFTGKVILDMAISLDGFISGPNNDSGGLYAWYFQPAQGPDDPNPGIVADLIRTTGAIVMGRRAYQLGVEEGYDDNPYRVEHFVLTHTPPNVLPKGDTSFNFVADGIESALRQAKAAAGDRHVAIGGGADIAQQYLRAGLVDEIHLHQVPVLLGGGLRLFHQLGPAPVELESLGHTAAPGVTHLRYRIMR